MSHMYGYGYVASFQQTSTSLFTGSENRIFMTLKKKIVSINSFFFSFLFLFSLLIVIHNYDNEKIIYRWEILKKIKIK